MKITIRGTIPSFLDGTSVEGHIKDFTTFVLSKFVSTKKLNSCSVDILLCPDNNYSGYSGWEDTNINPKEFSIKINFHSVSGLFRVLSHELVHVKQFMTGELVDSLKHYDKAKWKGEWMTLYSYGTPGYWDSPWEIEAFGREYGLLSHWFYVTDNTSKYNQEILEEFL